jgi:tRNA pseudouridine55 synthase
VSRQVPAWLYLAWRSVRQISTPALSSLPAAGYARAGMDGLINLNKPTGITSAKALYRVRKITQVRKSGHAGTLDPAAGGVLILCLGKATKLVEALMDQPKVYRASARLDVTSESFDSGRPLVEVPIATPPDEGAVRAACRRFEGTIEQVPPAISAVKVRGRPAYKRSRAGQTVELKSRPVQIYWSHVHRYEWPVLEFELACGRGTYVRALIRDLGVALGTGGCLTGLTRTAVGPFRIEQARTFDDLESATSREEYLIELDHACELLAVRPIRIPPRPGSTEDPAPSGPDPSRGSG